MPTIYDNQIDHLTDGLNAAFAATAHPLRADFCVGYFNLRGWHHLADVIDTLPGASVPEGDADIHRICRLIIGMSTSPDAELRAALTGETAKMLDNATAAKLRKQLAQDFRDQLTLGLPTDTDERTLRRLRLQLADGKLAVKLHLAFPLHAKLYLAYRDNAHNQFAPLVGFVGSSNLTLAGLSKQGELNVDVVDKDASQKLADWFDKRWLDHRSIDITKELIEIIDSSWASETPRSPYHIYLKIAYHLSQEARSGIGEFKIPKKIADELFDFQQKAVLVAAHHLNKRGGVLLGDVVGLGKTIMATALARLFEDDFGYETLIICPKNLTEMWKGYAHDYGLRAHIVPISKIQNETLRLRRYRLAIIDESHNLRNPEGMRYRALHEYLEKNETKVILLTATPYNKTYKDLSAQLRLFIPDDFPLAIAPDHYIASLGGEAKFSATHTDTAPRTIKAFEFSEEPDDWRELMRLYLVRRTRSFIKQNYAQTDPANNRKYLTFHDGQRSYFPDRAPKVLQYPFDPKDATDQYARLYSDAIIATIGSLNLPRYGLQKYLAAAPISAPDTTEEKIITKLTKAGRRLVGFCRVGLFKRLESSGYAFLLSVSRHIIRNCVFLHAIENDLPIPIGQAATLGDLIDIGANSDGDEDTTPISTTDKLSALFSSKTDFMKKAAALYNTYKEEPAKFFWLRSSLFAQTLRHDLEDDTNTLLKLLAENKDWKPAADRQLNALKKLITKTHTTEKILIFTQFADTARYLAENLHASHIAGGVECVTGDDENPTAKAHRFSP
ncbi:MAG: phospholipase D-like domain-containing protein, partial [Puniceicoccales bacterium]|nr:phospholipase D-like domain-containing protein [Puniceicoccales bacterium]